MLPKQEGETGSNGVDRIGLLDGARLGGVAPEIDLDVGLFHLDLAAGVVAEPDLANLRNAKSLVDLIKQGRPNDREPFLVLNKVNTPKRPEIAPKDFGEAMSMDPVELITFDPQLFGSAANNGQMIQEVAPNSKPMESFNNLAVMLTGKSEPKQARVSLLAPLLGKLKRKKG